MDQPGTTLVLASCDTDSGLVIGPMARAFPAALVGTWDHRWIRAEVLLHSGSGFRAAHSCLFSHADLVVFGNDLLQLLAGRGGARLEGHEGEAVIEITARAVGTLGAITTLTNDPTGLSSGAWRARLSIGLDRSRVGDYVRAISAMLAQVDS